MKIKIITEDLSPQQAAVAELIGLESTIALYKAVGGWVVWGSSSPKARLDPEIVSAIGLEKARTFQKHIDGIAIEMNTISRTENKAIRREVERLVSEGKNITQIYRSLRVPRNKVRLMIRRIGAERMLAELDG
jgi:hypothetical protein